MPIPQEVATALRNLQPPLKFGDMDQIQWIKVLEQWREAPCKRCKGTGSINSHPAGLSNVCASCDGRGEVWMKRPPKKKAKDARTTI